MATIKMKVGQKIDLEALKKDKFGNVIGKLPVTAEVEWTSSMENVVTVDYGSQMADNASSIGECTAVGAGTSTITATVDGDKIATINLEVAAEPWAGGITIVPGKPR